jgi:hypothetical protein
MVVLNFKRRREGRGRAGHLMSVNDPGPVAMSANYPKRTLGFLGHLVFYEPLAPVVPFKFSPWLLLKVIHFDQTFEDKMLNMPHHRLGPRQASVAESPVTLPPETRRSLCPNPNLFLVR